MARYSHEETMNRAAAMILLSCGCCLAPGEWLSDGALVGYRCAACGKSVDRQSVKALRQAWCESTNQRAREPALRQAHPDAVEATQPSADTAHDSTTDSLHWRFLHHPPSTPAIETTHSFIRGACKRLAVGIAGLVPAGREQSLALTKVEEAMMWANAGIARHQENATGPSEDT